jgi:3-deoxy-manno-octulosonate cytidylyltransferase (CMP-KDO synthetase)
MKIIGIIPARMKSSRLPGKAMKKIFNLPMIGHVYYRSKLSKVLNDVYVATCDDVIKNYINSINGKVIMTSKNHKRAVDRTAEALTKIEKITKIKADLIVMIQGDEPILNPQMINLVVNVLKENKGVQISNLFTVLNSTKEVQDPNRVKVVVDDHNNAIYFSREKISTIKKKRKKIYYKQGNIFCFRKKALRYFINLKPSNLEKVESVDMNRLIENRYKVKMVRTNLNTVNVDNYKDLQRAKKAMKKDRYLKLYNNKV